MCNLKPLFTADLASLRCIEEVRHHGAIAERGAVIADADDLLDRNIAELHGVVVLIAVRFLHNDFILVACDSAGN